MYKIKRKGSISKFLKTAQINGTTYEQVRSAVRQYIRANYQLQPGENPPIGLYGYSIQKAA